MSRPKTPTRTILKGLTLSIVGLLLMVVGYLMFFLPESFDRTFDLKNKKELTLYQSANLGFGYESFEGGGRQGFRIKAGHLRVRFEEPGIVWLGVKF